MKTETAIQVTQGRIAELQQAFFTGLEAWKTAGKLLVEIIEQDGLALGEIAEKADLPLDVLAQLEKTFGAAPVDREPAATSKRADEDGCALCADTQGQRHLPSRL
jgi:hypothetical protein